MIINKYNQLYKTGNRESIWVLINWNTNYGFESISSKNTYYKEKGLTVQWSSLTNINLRDQHQYHQ